MIKRASTLFMAIGLLLVSGDGLGQTAASRTIVFDLAAQPLAEALTTLAAQSNLRIVFNTADTQGLRSERVAGAYTAQTALKLLLRSSELRYRFIDERTVEIHGRTGPTSVSVERTR